MTTPRAWQRMLSGRRLDLLRPAAIDIELEDIAHGLSFVARWNGQTQGPHPYSVAEHSLLVENLIGRTIAQPTDALRLSALLHDAAEYVIGDMISPVKSAIGDEYGVLELRLTTAIRQRFGLDASCPPRQAKQIKNADRVSAWIEATQIAGFTRKEADKLFFRPPDHIVRDITLTPRPPDQVREAFLARATELADRIG